MSYIGGLPIKKTIPVTRGCDRAFTLQRTQNGSPTNFASGTTVYMWIDIDRASPTKVDAVVSGSTAAFHIQSTVLDLVRTGTKWRAVLDLGDFEVPLMVGKFERHDGG